MTSTKKVTGNKPKKRRLWFAILFSIGIIFVLYCVWFFFSLQEKFTVRMVTIPPDPSTGIVDYRFVIKTLDGFHTRTYDFGRYYGDHNLHKENNLVAFSPNFALSVEEVSKNSETEEVTLAIRGRTFDDFPVLALVAYNKGEFRSIPFYVGNMHWEIYFCAREALLKNLDDDPELEVILGVLLKAEDDSSQIWSKTRYDYNAEKQSYLQTSTTHEPSLE